jgi:hypothetical protein
VDYPIESRRQDGLFTRRQARAAGWSKGQIDRALANGELTALAPGVFLPTRDLRYLTPRERHAVSTRAQLLHLGEGWHAARRTAAVLHGIPLLGSAPRTPLLTRGRRLTSERSGSRFRRIAALPQDECTAVEGVAATTPARTVFDIARSESFRSAVVATDGALRAGLAPAELRKVLERHRGWPGSRQARAVVAFADGRAESPLESLARVICLEEGLPVFEPQVEVWLDGVLLARVDGLWRRQLLVFEGDGAVKFTDQRVVPALLSRQEALRDTGLDVLRADWHDVFSKSRAWAARARGRLAGRADPHLAPGVSLVSTRVRATAPEPGDSYRWAA